MAGGLDPDWVHRCLDPEHVDKHPRWIHAAGVTTWSPEREATRQTLGAQGGNDHNWKCGGPTSVRDAQEDFTSRKVLTTYSDVTALTLRAHLGRIYTSPLCAHIETRVDPLNEKKPLSYGSQQTNG